MCRDLLQRFRSGDGGNIAILFGVSLPLLFGAAGTAVDYGNMARIRAVERSVADSTALLVASADTPEAAVEGIRLATAQLNTRLSGQSANGGFDVTGQWLDGSNYRVTISTRVRTNFVHLLPGMPREVVVSTAATVNRVAPKYENAPPAVSQLSPEAADYNRIYFYCYSSDPKRQKEQDKGRRAVTPIADNGTPPTNYDLGAMPTCKENEAPSYMLRNVRDARSTRSRWDEMGRNTYEYYMDVTIDTGTRVQTVNMRGRNVGTGEVIDTVRYPMLETYLCDSTEKCRSRSDGGILPNRQTNRSPATATGSCSEGKFMYYGWEDRPGGDRDYDDIRLVVSCPKQIKVADKRVRIVE